MNSDELVERSRLLAERQAQLLGGVMPLRLQPGEDPTSPDAEDAIHWVAVYGELAGFKRDLIRQIDRYLEDAAQPQSRSELARDRGAAEIELERILLHLEYWRARQDSA